MKILICVEFYDPHIGGAEKHCKLIAEYLNKNNYKVEIATSFLKERKKKIINGVRINEFNVKGNFIRGYSGDITNYQNFLINSKFDRIIFYAAQQWSFDLSIEIIDKINSKLILIPCGFSKLQNFFYKPYFFLLRNKLNKFDKIICLSKDYQDYHFCKKYFKREINIINNGSENIFFRKKGFRKKFKILENEIMLLYLSNIKFMKGQDRLINIVKKIRNRKITLIFIHANNMSLFYWIYLKILILIASLNKNIKIKIFKNLKDIKLQEQNLNTVILLNPKNEEAVYSLAKLKLESSDYSKSKELNNKLISFCNKFCNRSKQLKIEIENLLKK